MKLSRGGLGKVSLFCLLTVLYCGPALAAIDAYEFPDKALEARYHGLIDQLRCPQCLNTNLAGSDAMIAQDLRREVHMMLLAGKSDDEILDFMYERYGDFILYKPRLTVWTILLWAGPLFFLLIGAFLLFRRLQTGGDTTAPVVIDRARLDAILEKSSTVESSSDDTANKRDAP